MDTRIFEHDSYNEIAKKIFENFELNQSCTVSGWLQDGDKMLSKGECVLEHLRVLDSLTNTVKGSVDKRMRRKRVILPDTIGGYVAHKIFKFRIETINSNIRVTIWRIQ